MGFCIETLFYLTSLNKLTRISKELLLTNFLDILDIDNLTLLNLLTHRHLGPNVQSLVKDLISKYIFNLENAPKCCFLLALKRRLLDSRTLGPIQDIVEGRASECGGGNWARPL